MTKHRRRCDTCEHASDFNPQGWSICVLLSGDHDYRSTDDQRLAWTEQVPGLSVHRDFCCRHYDARPPKRPSKMTHDELMSLPARSTPSSHLSPNVLVEPPDLIKFRDADNMAWVTDLDNNTWIRRPE